MILKIIKHFYNISIISTYVLLKTLQFLFKTIFTRNIFGNKNYFITLFLFTLYIGFAEMHDIIRKKMIRNSRTTFFE